MENDKLIIEEWFIGELEDEDFIGDFNVAPMDIDSKVFLRKYFNWEDDDWKNLRLKDKVIDYMAIFTELNNLNSLQESLNLEWFFNYNILEMEFRWSYYQELTIIRRLTIGDVDSREIDDFNEFVDNLKKTINEMIDQSQELPINDFDEEYKKQAIWLKEELQNLDLEYPDRM